MDHDYKVTHLAFIPLAPEFPPMFVVRWNCQDDGCEDEVLEVIEAREI